MNLQELREAQRLLEETVPYVRQQVLRNPNLWHQMPGVVRLEEGVALSRRLLNKERQVAPAE